MGKVFIALEKSGLTYGLIILIAAEFLGGLPVGPLITSGMLAIVARLVHK